MNLKRLFLSLTLLPFVALSSVQAQAETEYVILKNPDFTDVLRIGIDVSKETISVERCFEHSPNKETCQMIGKNMPISEIESVQVQINSRMNATFAGAFIGGAAFFGITSLCIAKGRCAGFMSKLFPDQPKGKIDWGLWLTLGSAAAGGTLGAYVGDTGASDVSAVLQIQTAIEEALSRDDNEAGLLVVETQASLSKIVESFSMLQLLIKSNAN